MRIMNENPHSTTPLPDSAFAFHGSHSRAVDAKGRFNLPFKFLRGGSGPEEEKFVVCEGADGSLSLLPHSVWLANYNRLRQGEPGPKLRAYLRRMSTNSKTVEPDSQGRVAVSREILAEIGVDKKVMIVGMGNYMELWDPATLAAMNAEDEGDDAFNDEFFR
jgi:MraZ protein